MQINPIVKKDLKVLSRSMKIAWAIFAFEAVLGMIFGFSLSVLTMDYGYNYGYTESYSHIQALFPIIGGTEIGIIALIMPIMTASSISGEKERQTFDILLTTPIKTFSIILGKNLSAVFRVMIFIIGSIPIMALSFTIGGLNWLYLLIYMAAAFIFALFAGSIGILASTFTKKSITAIILSYVMYGVFYGVTYVPLLIAAIFESMMGNVELFLITSFYILMVNPTMFFIELFTLMLNNGDGLMSELVDGRFGFLANDFVWVICSAMMLIGIAFLIMYLASRIIDPVRGKKRGAK